jgi:hypothetical protein
MNSNAGFAYENYDEFKHGMDMVVRESAKLVDLKRSAREYFLKQYSLEAYKKRLQLVFEGACPQSGC